MKNTLIAKQNKLKSRLIILSIVSNTVLVLLKLIAGFITGLASIIAEALHSANDLVASLVAYVGVNKSLKPPDEEHQYGHGKIETITGWIENILILLIGVGIIYEGTRKYFHRSPQQFVEIGIILMIFSGIVNYFISQYLIKKGRELGSVGIEVDGEHLRADVITSVGTAVILIILKITKLWWLDPAGAILIGLWVIGIFFKLSQKLTHQILDKGLSKNELSVIESILKTFPDVKGFHKLRTRQSGSTIFIDMHIFVNKSLTVQRAHDLTKEIENSIQQQFVNSSALIHIEPYRKLNI